MFPLAATVSNYLESFGASGTLDVSQLFPSQGAFQDNLFPLTLLIDYDYV